MSGIGIEDLLQTGSTPCEMTGDGAVADIEKVGNSGWVQIVPIGEDYDGPLPETQPIHGGKDFGSDIGLIDRLGKGGPLLTGASSAGGAVEAGGLVVDTAEEIGAPVDHAGPGFGVHGSENCLGDHVRRVGGTDEAGGEARQLVGVFAVDLAVGLVHTPTIPQPGPPGDTGA
jgi:hypothetical protein